MKKIVLVILLLFSLVGYAQIKGNVKDRAGNPLSFVSVYFENTLTGTSTNDSGDYALAVRELGSYVLVFQYLGYATSKKTVTVRSFPFVLNVVLEEEQVVLDEVEISSSENPANTIIRNAIAAKDRNTDAFAKYTAKFYSRGLFRVKNAPEKILGQRLVDLGGGLDSTRSGIIYLSETISEITYQKRPKNFKEKIIASKVSGSDNGISFNRAEEAYLNFYENSVDVAGSKLVSPIADGAFGSYRFGLEGTFYDKNGRLINKIAVSPKREGDRIFKGFIYIVEDVWAIYGVDLTTSGKQIGITIVGDLRFKQDYNFSDSNASWVLISQTIDFEFGFFGFNVDGRFSSAYSEYDFDPDFKKGTFSRQILSFADGATEKDSVYWNGLRPVPLTSEEVKDYQLKDSIKVVRKSKKYLDSIDKKRNKLSWLSPVTGYTYRNSYKKWSLSFNSPLENISYNTVQGWNATAGLSYFKRLNDQGKWWSTGVTMNYGLSDKELRPVFYFNKKWNNQDRPRLYIAAGTSTRQFNGRNPITRFNNTFYSLLREQNFLKIYDKTFARITYSQEVRNGVNMSFSLEHATRRPLFNTTNYVMFGSDNRSFTSNNPLDPTDNFSAPFDTHRIWTFNLGTNIVFGQRYLSYPNSKVNVGNRKFPSLYMGYRKTFGASNSEYHSDLLFARLNQFVTTGNTGNFKYNISAGTFLQQKDIPFMDYLHVSGNQLRFLPNSLDSFNLLDYYSMSTNNKYAEAHFEHNFKGFILSKIPLINTLNYHLVLGVKGLFTSENSPYSETAIGLDHIGFGKWRFFRIDYVRSNFNGIKNDGFLFRISLFN